MDTKQQERLNPLAMIDYADRWKLLEELREIGVEMKELDIEGQDAFEVSIPITEEDPEELSAQHVLARVIARYWNLGYSLEKNVVLPNLSGEGKFRLMIFYQTAKMTARRNLD